MAALDSLDVGPWRTCFLALHTCSFALACVLILSVVLSKHLRRLKTWIAFISSIVIFSLTFIILPISGYDDNNPPPLPSVCFRLPLAVRLPLCCCCSIVASILMMPLLKVYYMIFISLRCRPRHRWVHLLLLPPLLAHFVIFSLTIWTGIHNPERVITPSAVVDAGIAQYCWIRSSALSYSTVAYTAVASFGVAAASVYITALLYSNWRDYRELTSRSGPQAKENSSISLSVLVRLGLFFIMTTASTCLALSRRSWGSANGGMLVWDVMVMILPLAAVLLFGTQRDILHAWASWLRVSTWSVYLKCMFQKGS
ncbi:hypothetical protein BD779DRAFT_1593242 [Infundibulicybe gibba]|nr:hypothetical protein BD779DRAFT_1593242 [Infundibulicybe gibba]